MSDADHRAVYADGADGYQRLVGAEDVDGNLGPALAEAADLNGLRVLEIGAGTGRVTRVLHALGADLVATEPSAAMLAVARRLDTRATTFARCDAAALPLADTSFDVVIAGWVFAHQREWHPERWRELVSGFVAEADRVLAPGGTTVLVETLGTGTQTPDPPDHLAEYYAWLEAEHGFTMTWIRTDYGFESVSEAAEVTGAFFGPSFAELVHERGWSRIPECTGIWRRRS